MLFVGPNPAAIMAAQRDLLVQDVVNLMERHFDGAELGGVVQEIDKAFSQRFEALVSSLELPPRGGWAALAPVMVVAIAAHVICRTIFKVVGANFGTDCAIFASPRRCCQGDARGLLC